MRKLIMNGPNKWPGAKFYQANKPGSIKKFLKFANREEVAKLLKPGDKIERHLKDGSVELSTSDFGLKINKLVSR